MRMDGFADIYGVCTHFNRQRDFTNHVASMCAHHATTQDFPVAVGFG